MELKVEIENDHYATVYWTPRDIEIISRVMQITLTEEEIKELLKKAENDIEGVMVKAGWDYIESELLQERAFKCDNDNIPITWKEVKI